MTKAKPNKSPTLSLSPSVDVFRARHNIMVADEIMQSAQARYLRHGEVTFLAARGFGVRSEVSVHCVKPTSTSGRPTRMRTMSQYANRVQLDLGKLITVGDQAELPRDAEDRLRLFGAFHILIESEATWSTISPAERKSAQTIAMLTIIDFYPNAAVVYGLIQRLRPAHLERFGLATSASA